MLPDEVREAVREVDAWLSGTDVSAEWAAIKAHLLAREVEVEGMRTLLDLLRTDKSGTRRDYVESRAGTMVRITAHLSENSRGND